MPRFVILMINICSVPTCWSHRDGAGNDGPPGVSPAGDWYDWHSGELFGGNQFLLAPTPMDHIPVYARAGAVIPMWPDAPSSTDGYHPAEIELHLFVPTAMDATLRRAGGRRAHRSPPWTERATGRRSRSSERTTKSRCQASVSGQGYPEFARERLALVLHGAASHRSGGRGGRHWRAGRFILPNSGTPFSLEFAT